MKIQLLVPAAGMGTRLEADGPKALTRLAGQPMIVRTLTRFAPLGLVDEAVIVVPPGCQDAFEAVLADAFPHATLQVVPGGAERQDSVDHGLAALDPRTGIVVIHDAARPFVSAESVQASIAAARECGAATVAIPSVDTILQGDGEAYLERTPDRRRMWACQTPQTFRVDVIREAHRHARTHGFVGTDDASLVRRIGGRVKLVMGTPLNLKVTTPTDLVFAEAAIREGLV